MSVAHEDHSLDSRHRYESRPVGNVTYSPTPSAYRQEQSPEQSGPSPLASVALPTWDRLSRRRKATNNYRICLTGRQLIRPVPQGISNALSSRIERTFESQ